MKNKANKIIQFFVMTALLLSMSTFSMGQTECKPAAIKVSQEPFTAIEPPTWPLAAIDWISEYHGSGVTIAVIDTGISTKNNESSHVLEGKNYVFPKCMTKDLIGHGTHISGIILGSEAMGIQGVASDAELVPLVYYSKYPSGVPLNGGIEKICEAIYDAVDVYRCKIINISSGIPYDDKRLRLAVSYAEKKGVLIISAVGNDNLNSPEKVYYPAAYDTVIGVGAADIDGQPALSSQRNSSVMLLAPGVEIPAVTNKNSKKPEIVSGSSYATAYVTGAAALLLECRPDLVPVRIREILCRTAADLGETGYDEATGWGCLSIKNSIALVEDQPKQKNSCMGKQAEAEK